MQVEALIYRQGVFWFCGTAFNFEDRFSEGLQNSTGPLTGVKQDFQGTKGKMLGMCGVLVSYPQLRLQTQAQRAHQGPIRAELS